MKISSVSKKVLASALSAAMVVAFAPTVAFAGDTVVAKNSYVSTANGQTVVVDYYDAALAFEKAGAAEDIVDSNGNSLYSYANTTVALVDDITVEDVIEDDDTHATILTIDLGGKTLTSKGDLSHTWAFTTVGDGTIDGSDNGTSTFASVTVGTEKDASNVTFDGGIYSEVAVAEGSSITLSSGTFTISNNGTSAEKAATKAAFEDAVAAAKNAGATVTGTVDNGEEITVSKTVATVGGVEKSSLTQAISDANGAEIVLQADLKDAEASINPLTKNAVINLNGHTLDRAVITLGPSKTLTLKGEGKLAGVTTTVGSGSNIVIADSSNIVIADSGARKAEKTAKVSALGDCLVVEGALSIENAVPTAGRGLVNITVDKGTLNVAKGTFGTLTVGTTAGGSTGEGVATINGGTFEGITPHANATLSVAKAKYKGANMLADKYVAEGSVSNTKDATWNEIGTPVATAQAVREAADGTEFTSGVQCASLQGAVYNATDKTIVTLDADVEEYAELADPTTKLTIDLGGHTVKGGIKGDAKITVKNGTVNGYGKIAVEGVTIESGTFTAEADADKVKPAYLAKDSVITGGTFKNATFGLNGCTVKGGTFDKKVTPADGYSIAENADGTFSVSLGGVACGSFGAINGVIKKEVDTVKFTIADKDKALEKAVEAAYSKVLTAAWPTDPKATALDGFKFAEKDPATHELYNVKNLTDNATKVEFVLSVTPVALEKSTLVADKDYSVVSAYKVTVAVVKTTDSNNGVDLGKTIGTLTGIAVDVTYEYAQTDTANYTYGFLGDEKATYDAEKKLYTFSTATGAEFGVEKISNSILELQEQVKQMEIAAQDKAAANSIKGTAKTIKTKKGVTAKKYTAKVKAVTSESGAVATYKKANTAGKSKITVSKSGTITIKKGLKKGTYKVKVKGTVGASSKTVTAKIVIK